jgi:hypothetical protein
MFIPLAPAAQNLGVGLRRFLKLDLHYPCVCGATRAGQRAARREVQKHKPSPANDREKARSSSAFNFRADKEFGKKRGQDATSHQIAQFYV